MENANIICTAINLAIFIFTIRLVILNKKRRAEISSIDTQVLAAQAYLILGEITCDMPDNPQIVHVLDYFSDVANGDAQVDFDRSFLISAPYEKSPN